MCKNAAKKLPFVIRYVSDQQKTQEMCDKAVFEDPFLLKYCLDRYKTQEMCDKAVDDFLRALKLVTDWFVTSKVAKKLRNSLFTDSNVIFFDKDSSNVTFSSDEMGILRVDLNDFSLDHINFDEDDLETVIHVRLIAWRNRF